MAAARGGCGGGGGGGRGDGTVPVGGVEGEANDDGWEDSGMASPGATTSRPPAKRARLPGSSTSCEDAGSTELPPHFARLPALHALADGTISWLLDRHLPCTVYSVAGMMAAGAPDASREALLTIVAVAPALFVLRRIPGGGAAPSTQSSSSSSSSSSSNSNKNRSNSGSSGGSCSSSGGGSGGGWGTGSGIPGARAARGCKGDAFDIPSLPDIVLLPESDSDSGGGGGGGDGNKAGATLPTPPAPPPPPPPPVTPLVDDAQWVEITVQPPGGSAAKRAARQKRFRVALAAYLAAARDQWAAGHNGGVPAPPPAAAAGTKRPRAALPPAPPTGFDASSCPLPPPAALPPPLHLLPHAGSADTPPPNDAHTAVLSRFAAQSTSAAAAAAVVAAAAAILQPQVATPAPPPGTPPRGASHSAAGGGAGAPAAGSPAGVASTVAALTNAAARRVTVASGVASAGASTATEEGHRALPPLTFDTVEAHLRAASYYVDQLSVAGVTRSRDARYGEADPPLHPAVTAALAARGIPALYAHQAAAINAARAGRSVVISTATSSGKTLTFTLPILEAQQADAATVALYLSPTKALAQDQLRALTALVGAAPALAARTRPATLDGDTAWADRTAVRDTANVILTNPDILHVTLLPHHARWRRVLANLRYVVLDEAHAYRGVFGSHVALILRRLLRLAAHYGSTPTFVVCSATIANPYQHFRALVPSRGGSSSSSDGGGGGDPSVCFIGASDDGAAVGRRKFLIWNPPVRLPPGSSGGGGGGGDGSGGGRDDDGGGGKGGDGNGRGGDVGDGVDEGDGEGASDGEGERGGTCGRRAPAARAVPVRDRTAVAIAMTRHALQQRFSVPSLHRPTAYRRDAASSSYGIQRAAAAAAAASAAPAAAVGGDAPRTAVASCSSSNSSVNGGGGGGGGGGDGVAEAAGRPQPRWLQQWLDHAPGTGAAARRSPIVESAALLTTLVLGGMRTIVFCRVRKVAELLLQYTHERLATLGGGGGGSGGGGGGGGGGSAALAAIPKVKSYRAGYLKAHRRAIEADLFGGRLLGVVATNALELGVDIGCLDAALLVGYPGSAAALWQQAGRAGRGGRDAVAIMVAYDNAIDQHFATHPGALLAKPPEAALIDATNPHLLRAHALCAAAELPLQPAELATFGEGLGAVVAGLRAASALVPSRAPPVVGGGAGGGGGVPAGGVSAFEIAPWVPRPAAGVNIRSIDDVVYRVVDDDTGAVVDEVEESRAYYEVHEGAMHMNQGVTYKVHRLDVVAHVAHARVSTEQYYTALTDHTDVNAVARLGSTPDGRVHWGRAAVIMEAWSYAKVWKRTGRVFETCDVVLPPIEYATAGVWYDVPVELREACDARAWDVLGGSHGAGHALMAVLPLFVLVDRSDVGTECSSPAQVRARPSRVILYDKHAGGVGIAAAAFRAAPAIFSAALDLVLRCPCATGCPACIHDPRCGGYNVVLDKDATRAILMHAVFGILPGDPQPALP